MEKQNLFMNGDELQNCIFNHQNWENSNSDPFGSALSSMVSSPAGAPPNVDNFVLRELIGRLGSICNNNSGEININNSNNNSCYSTPLNSPPKLNLFGPSLPQFSGDPGFAERAARFSCFADKTFKESDLLGFPNLESGKISRVSSNHSMKIQEFGDNSRENSSVSEQISNSRKRKSVSKGKAKESTLKNAANVSSEKNESNAKRSKSEENNEENKTKEDEKTENKDNQKPPEAPKDYIHVRARRGQATDAHSLAERVRREKISERMKVLQDLVPGCNKVTGKAVMLDEIINYVQSLQRQVEFLSMKLATVNPRMDFNMEALLSKDMFQSRGSLAHNMYQPENSGQAFPYGFQSQAINHLNPNLGRNPNMQLPSLDGYVEPTPQVPTFFEDELHGVVQMGFGQNQDHNYLGYMTNSQMKPEL